MKHARSDYDQIQDPSGKIPKSEPVFLLRAQDVLAPAFVLEYATRYEMAGGDPEIAEAIRAHARYMASWVKKKIPDVPKENMRRQSDYKSA